MTSALHGRPDAATYTIEDLVPMVWQGKLRVPTFQRLFKWRPSDVRDLFDSLYRGFPIGTLLFWKKPAPAGRFFLGPVEVDAPEQTEALWIVDGQQRLSSLVGVLAPPGSPAAGFDLYFDLSWEDGAETGRRPTPFHFADPRRPAEATWLPMRVVLNSEQLDVWLDDSELRNTLPEYVRRARRLNRLLREYKIPAYVVDTEDTETLGLIFDRINNAGIQLDRSEIFNALFAGADQGYSLPELRRRIGTLGFGDLHQDLLLKVVLATDGFDITTVSGKRLRESRLSHGAFEVAESALYRAIEFLRSDARIPHKELLPYEFPLLVLTRFFRAHPDPRPRSRALLSRWLWRGAITGEHRGESIPWVRALFKGLLETDHDEEAAVQALLRRVSPTRPALEMHSFRFNAAQSKLVLLALAAFGPRDLVEGAPIDLGLLLAEEGRKAIANLAPAGEGSASLPSKPLGSILIHPPISRRMLTSALSSASPEILQSHGIDPEAGEALRRHDWPRVLELRQERLKVHIESFLDSRARWNETDRPSLAWLSREPEGESPDGG